MGRSKTGPVGRRQEDQGHEAPFSRRYAGFAAPCHCSSGRYPRSRWRRTASCHPIRDVSLLEKAFCRRWISGARIPQGLGENPAPPRSCNRQALRSGQRICRASTPLDRRADDCLLSVHYSIKLRLMEPLVHFAQSLPKACQGLGEPQSQGAGFPAPRFYPPHAPKTL